MSDEISAFEQWIREQEDIECNVLSDGEKEALKIRSIERSINNGHKQMA